MTDFAPAINDDTEPYPVIDQGEILTVSKLA
jgi:hypothetical protein